MCYYLQSLGRTSFDLTSGANIRHNRKFINIPYNIRKAKHDDLFPNGDAPFVQTLWYRGERRLCEMKRVVIHSRHPPPPFIEHCIYVIHPRILHSPFPLFLTYKTSWLKFFIYQCFTICHMFNYTINNMPSKQIY